MIRTGIFSAIVGLATLATAGAQNAAGSETVLRLEAYLQQLGFHPGPVDGVVDASTNAAIIEYQKSRGLAATGGMTAEEFAALEREVMPFRATPTMRSFGPMPRNRAAGTGPIGTPSIHRQEALGEYAAALYREHGLTLGLVAFPAYGNKQYAMVDYVLPGGNADASGLTFGDLFVSQRSSRVPNNFPPSFGVEEVSALFLDYLKDGGAFFEAETSDVNEVITNYVTTGVVRGNSAKQVIFPYPKLVRRAGIVFDSDLKVLTVLPNSPAELAGVRVGDTFLTGFGTPAYTRSVHQRGWGWGPWKRSSSITADIVVSRLSKQITRYSDSDYLVETKFLRDGEMIPINFAPVAWGEVLSTKRLTQSEEAIFEKLPVRLKPFLQFIYLDDFNAAMPFQMNIWDSEFRGTPIAALTSAFGGSRELRDKFRASRGVGILSQYMLIKTNSIGLCGAQGQDMRVTQRRFRVWEDGYGFEISRREIEPNVYEFTVPVDWVQHLEKNPPLGEARQWSRPIDEFIESAGGCESTILPKLERNMQRYLALAED